MAVFLEILANICTSCFISFLSSGSNVSDASLVAPTIAVDLEGLAHELELDADTLVEKLGGTQIVSDVVDEHSRAATPLPPLNASSDAPDLYRTLAVVCVNVRSREYDIGREGRSGRGARRGASGQHESRPHSRAEEREPLLTSGTFALDLQGLVGDDNVAATRVADGDVPQLASGTATPKAGGPAALGVFVARDVVVTFPGDLDTAYLVPVPEAERWAGPGHATLRDDVEQYLLLVPRDEAPTPANAYEEASALDLPALPSVPTAVQHVDVYLEGPLQHAQLVISVQLRTSLAGYMILLAALVTVSSMGAVTKTVAATETIAGSWRSQIQCAGMLPLAIYQMLRVRRWEWRAMLNKDCAAMLIWCSLGNFAWMLTFWIGLQYTTVTHAYLLNNCICVFIYLRKLLFGYGYTRMEEAGVLLVVLGALVAIIGTAIHGEAGHTTRGMVVGDIVAFGGALGGVVYVEQGKALRQEVPLFMYMLPVNVFLLVFGTWAAVVIDGATWDRNLATGLFAWATREYIWQGLYLGIVTGLVGSVAYIACLRFVSPLVVAVVMSSEPIVSGAIATVLKVDQPDFWTVVGGAILIGGCLTVVLSERERKVTRNINEFVDTCAGAGAGNESLDARSMTSHLSSASLRRRGRRSGSRSDSRLTSRAGSAVSSRTGTPVLARQVVGQRFMEMAHGGGSYGRPAS